MEVESVDLVPMDWRKARCRRGRVRLSGGFDQVASEPVRHADTCDSNRVWAHHYTRLLTTL